jgi:hypothetical protein
MSKTLFNDAIKILTLWVIEDSITDDQCIGKLMLLGFDNDSIDFLMDIVNCKAVAKVGVKQIIIDYLDQSYCLDDELDDFKTVLAERLDISYDRTEREDPYEEYLKTESGVYA